MSKIAEIKYNGEIGFKAKIKDVLAFLKILIPVEDFLKFTNEKGIKNSTIILNSYSIREKVVFGLANSDETEKPNAEDLITGDMFCPNPIKFFVNVSDVTVDLLVNQSNLMIADDSTFSLVGKKEDEKKDSFTVSRNKFYDEIITQTKLDFNSTITFKDLHVRTEPIPQVWVWCKSLNQRGYFNENSIFDLTPFITNLTTNQSETGGNFSIELQSIDAFLKFNGGELDGVWNPDKRKYIKFNEGSNANYFFRKFLEKTSELNYNFSEGEKETFGKRNQNIPTNQVNTQDTKVNDKTFKEFVRTEDFFKNLISENDIIFISFDKDVNIDQITDDFFVNHSSLPGKDWDMIGLVDNNGISTNYENTEIGVSVSGRDCMKLLIEDGSYFFAKSYANPENSDGIFFNTKIPNSGDAANTTNSRIDGSSRGINRLITTGIIDMLYNPEARNIQFIMNLLISRLSNIEICNDDLFKHYGEKRTKFSIPFIESIEDSDNSIDTTDGD